MFSANENIVLRQHKRRICQYVDDCIPEDLLDLGTSVMVMQVSCRAPGCVPLETMVCIVFPLDETVSSFVDGLRLKNSTFKTKVLKPMADVTKDDILDALPSNFMGGRRTMERMCRQARDVMLAQITQIMGTDENDDNDIEGKTMMATYLQQCLQEYIDRKCVAPPIGEDYAENLEEKLSPAKSTKEESEEKKEWNIEDNRIENSSDIKQTGNFVTRRVIDDETDNKDKNTEPSVTISSDQNGINDLNQHPKGNATPITTKEETSMDWRRRQEMERNVLSGMSSRATIAKLAEREHEPGLRRAGCPCCDPDNPSSNVLDQMNSIM